jgi:hypothetical protein
MIVLELADETNPQRAARLVVDVDMKQMHVRKTTLSDAAERVASGALPDARSASQAAELSSRAGHGPRKTPVDDDSPSNHPNNQKKYHWGQPTVTPKGPDTRAEGPQGPFRLERWGLQKRPMARDG